MLPVIGPSLCPVSCTGLTDGAWLNNVRRTSRTTPSINPWMGERSPDSGSVADAAAAARGARAKVALAVTRVPGARAVGVEGVTSPVTVAGVARTGASDSAALDSPAFGLLELGVLGLGVLGLGVLGFGELGLGVLGFGESGDGSARTALRSAAGRAARDWVRLGSGATRPNFGTDPIPATTLAATGLLGSAGAVAGSATSGAVRLLAARDVWAGLRVVGAAWRGPLLVVLSVLSIAAAVEAPAASASAVATTGVARASPATSATAPKGAARANFDITAPPRYLPVTALLSQPICAATPSSTSPRDPNTDNLRFSAQAVGVKPRQESGSRKPPASA